jgi:hypothetical protein
LRLPVRHSHPPILRWAQYDSTLASRRPSSVGCNLIPAIAVPAVPIARAPLPSSADLLILS